MKEFLFKESSKKYFIILLFVVLGFSLYANSFKNQMFWDDNDFVVNNQYIKDWQYFPEYFSQNVIAGSGLLSNYWRPALLTVYSIEWHIWGDWNVGYHFINTSFHIIDSILLFLILFYLFKKKYLALFTSLIFLAHPLQTEAVVYVSSLGDSLSVFFIFLGIFLFLKFRLSDIKPTRSLFYFVSLLMYPLALMSKETAIIMPALIFIVDFCLEYEKKEHSFKKILKRIGKIIWPFITIAGIYILLRATSLDFINTFNLYNESNILTSSMYVRLLTFFGVLTTYFCLLFWPFNLHMERSINIATAFHSFPVIFGGIIFVLLIVLAFTKFKRWPILSFGILWFFIGLAPTSNIAVPINGLLYEHWLYLPMIGVFLVVVWLGELLAKKHNLQKVLLVIFILFFVFLSVLTIRRNIDWHNPIVFYNQTLKYSPNDYRVLNNLGMAYADNKDIEKAEEIYNRAISVSSSTPVAYHNLGNLYKEINKNYLAIENFNKAISIDPNFTFSYNALVNLYLKEKDYKNARLVLEKYLKNSGSKLDVFPLLVQIAVQEKDYNGALVYLNEALNIDPNNQDIKTAIYNIKNLIETGK